MWGRFRSETRNLDAERGYKCTGKQRFPAKERLA
jgi:hypothetical protein